MDIKMPKLGESVHEGTIEQWLVSVGDQVDEYEPLCEVITDKVTAEVPSTMAGTISEIIVKEGETVSINSIICKIDSQNENQATSVEEKNNNNQNQLTEEITSKSESKPKNNGRFSPVVFRLASEHNIDLTQVHGTGFEGRVTKKDIQNAIDNPELVNHPTTNDEMIKNTNISSATTSEHTNKSSLVDISITQQSSLPVKGVRKSIAQNMVTSVTEIPHGWMMVEVDATNLVKTRNYHKASFKQNEGYNLTFFAFFVKAVAEALKANPLLNSTWQGDEIIIHKDINISIAVADNDKLYVPVIKNADEKSIKGIAREINELALKARHGQLSQQDMQGGTFTVNNTGSFGSISSMGIINHPQAAILQVESIVKKPVVINDMIAIRSMVNLCISIDHRILDGVQTGQFMDHIKKRIEHYTVENTTIY
ncbi:dihydrolipoamide acetyltransferase family protein [Staphylococcus saccharolyticus]|uniref:dihydrolipoamide acetyltransferase family protein n=1 Tax=Staphylococcus saccharolyticus TaxID=33028 RepID=UPI00102DDB94|nr:dihydrolipoamide acetyltransferase family protein [Staphylococcus saccharolyticus]TAA93791.1 2-oxoglutarate dehydrogenase [Staphylococcus saccharolyticus]TAA94756.1 2-oxoglutarate dehydrogenase [Staphylococcus saccharolyticus]